MNLQDLYSKIEGYAMNTKNVKQYYVGDPYVILNSLHINYPVFNTALNYVTYQDHTVTINMSFYYVAKLANDSSDLFDLQSEGINAIWNVLKHLEDDYEMDSVNNVQLYVFNQKFADICCGAWCVVDIVIPLDYCENYDKE